MHKSKHAKQRMAQRAITQDDVETILSDGSEFSAAGGAKKILITREKYRRLRTFYEDQIRVLDNALGKALVISSDDTIITVEHISGRVKYE